MLYVLLYLYGIISYMTYMTETHVGYRSHYELTQDIPCPSSWLSYHDTCILVEFMIFLHLFYVEVFFIHRVHEILSFM